MTATSMGHKPTEEIAHRPVVRRYKVVSGLYCGCAVVALGALAVAAFASGSGTIDLHI